MCDTCVFALSAPLVYIACIFPFVRLSLSLCRNMSRNFISTNQELRRGDSLISNNGDCKAVFQDDGNFVLYKWTPVWAADTAGPDPYRLILQTDSNLVIYDKTMKPLWASGNHDPKCDCKCMRLTLTDDAKLQVENDAKPIWCNGCRL
uniref:Bulb-type lectin domain-containing protein n=1 Tax=Neogobius melanostomus TaxID=47308 RepID=A0A8C6SAN3_9GOBI